MPRGDRRWGFFRNISTFSAILSLSRLLPSVSADGHHYLYGNADAPAWQSTSPSPTAQSQDSTLPTEFMIKERQLPSNVITLPLALFTSIPLSTTNSNPLPAATPFPLLISPFILPSPSPSVSLSLPSTSSPFVTSTISASAQSSPSGNSSATANDTSEPNRLTALNFVPFIILTSFFIISLMGWCLHGWCTRRPKENFVATVGMRESRQKTGGWFWRRRGGWGRENDLISGPAYVSFVGQDVEEFATVRQSRYRWPSLSVKNQGPRYHVSQDDHDESPFLSKSMPPELAGLPIQTVRSVPSADPPRTAGKTLLSPTTTTGPMSPTSIALRELYEVVLRNEYDGPSGGASEGCTTPLGVGSGVMTANRSTSGRKRKPHVRQGSESHEVATQLLGGRWKSGMLSSDDNNRMSRNKLEVRNPSVGEGRLGLREEDIGLFGSDEEDQDQYTPLPTPTRVGHRFAIGEPPTGSLRGRKARGKAVQNPQNISSRVSKDVLPAHPKQITSPPLESQMYFVPMQTTAENDIGFSSDRRNESLVGLVSPPARVRGGVRPKAKVPRPTSEPHSRSSSREKLSVQYPSGVTTSPLRINTRKAKSEDHNAAGQRDGASKGKGKLVKPSPAARQGGRLPKGVRE